MRRFVRDGQDRLKSSADLHMLMDIMETALDRPQVSTYVLMTGDSDYIRVITWIKNRFEKRVIVSGVPGTITGDLVCGGGRGRPPRGGRVRRGGGAAADGEAITLMMKRMTPPTGFWTIKLIDQWARDHRNGVPGNDPDKSNAICYMLRNGLMRRYKTVTDVREVTISELDETNPYVKDLLQAVGLDLNPMPVRCMACNEVCAADAGVCGCCGASIVAQWVNGTE